MLKINVLAVGKIKEKYFVEALNEYTKRISRFANLKVIEIEEANDKLSLSKIIEKESAELIENAKGNIILLDIGGQQLSSCELAEYASQCLVKGCSEITFVVGGSNGFNDEVRKIADKRISFGKITYPHQLVRVVLLEQIYRFLTINNNVAYHK